MLIPQIDIGKKTCRRKREKFLTIADYVLGPSAQAGLVHSYSRASVGGPCHWAEKPMGRRQLRVGVPVTALCRLQRRCSAFTGSESQLTLE